MSQFGKNVQTVTGSNFASRVQVDTTRAVYSASAPTDGVLEGTLWYDTANAVLKVYNGSAWIDVTTG